MREKISHSLNKMSENTDLASLLPSRGTSSKDTVPEAQPIEEKTIEQPIEEKTEPIQKPIQKPVEIEPPKVSYIQVPKEEYNSLKDTVNELSKELMYHRQFLEEQSRRSAMMTESRKIETKKKEEEKTDEKVPIRKNKSTIVFIIIVMAIIVIGFIVFRHFRSSKSQVIDEDYNVSDV